VYFWVAQLVVVPLVTMRLLAGERQAGTLELLFTAPVSAAAIVAGKFAGAYVFYLALWIPTAAYVVFVAQHGPVDAGAVVAGYAGVAAVGAALVAVGVLASALAPSPVVAGGAAFAALLALYGLGHLEPQVAPGGALASWLDYASLGAAMSDFGRGIVDTRRLAFPLSLALVSLFFAARALEWRRAR
jgi:ABC-2 type transport system permease protein